METRKITDLGEMEQIYYARMKGDFAPNELRPWASLRKSWERGEYDGYGLYEGDELLGYAFFVRLAIGGEAFALFDYLAIAKEHRDEGLGSVFLGQLARRLRDARCVIGEVEDPDAAEDTASREIRERRLRFYLRNGCRMTELRSEVFGVDYRILELPTGNEYSAEELREIYSTLYRAVLPAAFFKTCFRIK